MNTYLNKCIKNRFGPWTILFLLFFLISIPGSYISQVSQLAWLLARLRLLYQITSFLFFFIFRVYYFYRSVCINLYKL